MKNNLKRVLSFVLVMMLMISCVPTMAFAAEDSTAYAAQNITTGVGYDSLASAMEAAEAGQTVKALADCAEPVSYRDGVILDLNGHALTNVTVAADATVTAIDSATDDYKGSFGTLSGDIAGTVAATVKTAEPKSYVSVCENGSWSFHRYYASITAISLKPASAALGYKAEFYGDEAVKNAVVSYGYELWVNNNAPKALSKSDKLEKNVLTLRLQNILKEGDAALNAAGSTATINGKAFITLNLNGKEVTLYGAEQSTTLRSTIEAINANVASYSESALQAVRSLCTTYAAWMAGWATENIFGVAEGEGDLNVEITVPVTAENNVVTEEAVLSYQNIVAIVPAGAQLAEGTTELKLTITDKASSDSDVSENEGETLRPLDVHIEGISEDNTAPIIICLGNVLPKGLNIGNYELYHVEDGNTVPMTLADSVSALDVHNEFCYDPATGAVTVAVCSFSEIAMTSTPAVWEGNSAAPVEKNGVYYIYNADQLRGFAEMVGGMNGYSATDFAGKTVVLQADIDLNDTDSENGRVFYPVGYYNTEGTYEKTGNAIESYFNPFKGTFDGNGHTISNFYQNTWEMKGDHNWYDASAQNYRDGMGLFGKVYGGTVKNLTVENFSSDGEIATTGTIAAYADCGATFENISIFNCNPRVYNIGNGGIVGCVGWYNNEVTDENSVTFKNITVDNTNKISALWGSWDVACGGLVGQYYPTSGQTNATDNAGIYMENCHVTAQIDVNNDVCANYQYYAYRYAGILIGSVRENVTIDGREYPNMDGITAKDCTVGFGDWNDYYYCELVANSIASYTHDYQFSRLTQVKAVNGNTITYLDGKTETVPDEGRYNYVVVNGAHATEKATCYHFVDGQVWDHETAGYEDLDGDGTKETLIENNQHIYLEFNNLITGYGWGVTSKGVDDMDGVTILDKSAAEKFTYVGGNTLTTGQTVSIGSLFQAVEGATLDADNVQVFVSPVNENSTISGVYTADPANWQNGTLTISGSGMAEITITDYYYCTATTATVKVVCEVNNLSNHNSGWDIDRADYNDGLYIQHDAHNATYNSNWSVEYKPVSADAIKLIRGGETFSVAVTDSATLVAYGATEMFLKLENWTISGNMLPLVEGDQLIIEGEFKHDASGDILAIEKTTVDVVNGSLGINAISVGALGNHSSGADGDGVHVTMANSDAPYNADWTLEYAPLTANSYRVIRDGVETNIGQPGRGTLVKFSATEGYLKHSGWCVNDFTAQTSDIFIIEGFWKDKAGPTVIQIDTTYLYYNGGKWVCSSKLPTIVDMQELSAHTVNGWTTGGSYFQAAANNAPYNGDWSLRYTPTNANAIRVLNADGTESNVGNTGAETIVKYSETEYYLEGWPIGYLSAGKTIVIDGMFYNAANDIYICITNTYITFSEDGTIIVSTTAP